MTRKNEPLLSVIIATFNRLEVLKQSVSAVLQQDSTSNVELIVVDDSSTDGTWQWLESMGPRVTRVRTEANAGPGAARNLGISKAAGQFFLPLDSDCLLIDGALPMIMRVLQKEGSYFNAFFFPCIEYPAQRRMDALQGNRPLSYEDLLYGRHGIRELLPVVSTGYIGSEGLAYPEFRSGGESMLWVKLLKLTPALFVDTPVAWYRTDVPNRLCSAESQLRTWREMAKIADALLELFPKELSADGRRAKARRLMAAGTYHALSGDPATARRRFVAALALGRLTAIAPFAVSLMGRVAMRYAFWRYRSKCTAGFTLPAAQAASR